MILLRTRVVHSIVKKEEMMGLVELSMGILSRSEKFNEMLLSSLQQEKKKR